MMGIKDKIWRNEMDDESDGKGNERNAFFALQIPTTSPFLALRHDLLAKPNQMNKSFFDTLSNDSHYHRTRPKRYAQFAVQVLV
jgi:hypothetical protein